MPGEEPDIVADSATRGETCARELAIPEPGAQGWTGPILFPWSIRFQIAVFPIDHGNTGVVTVAVLQTKAARGGNDQFMLWLLVREFW